MVEPRAEQMLGSSDPIERQRAVELLAMYGDPRSSTTTLGAQLGRTAFQGERLAMIRAIARMGRPEAVNALIDARRLVRDRELIFALGSFSSDEAIRELVAALADTQDATTARAALLRVGARAVPRLLRALRDPVLAQIAIETLGEMGDGRALVPLIGMLDSSHAAERLAAVNALVAMQDDRAIPALLAHRADSDVAVRRGILRALGLLGARDSRGLFADALRSDDADAAAIAIVAWMRAEPQSASGEVGRILAGPASATRDAAQTELLGSSDSAWVDVMRPLIDSAPDKQAVAFALARLDHGAGISALVAELSGPNGAKVYTAVGVGLRTWEHEIPASVRADALRELVRHRDVVAPRLSILTRALARDSDVSRWLRAGLADANAQRRAESALGFELLGDGSALDALTAALRREEDAECYRRMAMAILSLRGYVEAETLFHHLADVQRGPESLLLLARELPALSYRDRRRTREAMRRFLRANDPRVRATAARALGIAHDTEAVGALLRLLDDEVPAVRVACARALASFALSDAQRARVRGIARTETDSHVFDLLRMVADGYVVSRHDVRESGSRVLVARWVNHTTTTSAQTSVDVVLEDGRWLRMTPMTEGLILLADLVSGDANIFSTQMTAALR